MRKEKRNTWSRNTSVEYATVAGHYHRIFNPKSPQHSSYKGMSFFDGWNPKKGGSYQAGADWIITNLGKRPENTSLHIVDHLKGFVPGNLEWTHPKKQTAEQMFKIIARLRHEIKEKDQRICELEARLAA